jgi:F0F1-type ATP synthase assembly protein I
LFSSSIINILIADDLQGSPLTIVSFVSFAVFIFYHKVHKGYTKVTKDFVTASVVKSG